MSKTKEKKGKSAVAAAFLLVLIGLVLLFFLSVNLGSIHLSFGQLFRGLFVAYDREVASVYDLRFPRILISMLAGAGLACAGALFQAVLKNPLADPGILGVSSGAGFFAVLAATLFPKLYFFVPVFSFFGGLLVFLLVYSLAYKGTLSPLRIILMGVAMQALFSGLSGAVNSMSGGNQSGVASIVEGTITMKTWNDVRVLALFLVPGLILTFLSARWCNLMGLEDKTIRGLGVPVDRVRLLVSLLAVFLVGGCTAIVGTVSFLGLLVPHIGRLLVGNEHRRLLPFSALLGAFLFLLADTLGRRIAYPYEIQAGVILSVVGGITFIILLRRSGGIYGK